MKSYKISLLVLVLLLAVSAGLLLSRRSGTYARSAVEFAVKDTGQIESVEIRDGAERLLLVRQEGTWRVNGITPVRKDRMGGMLVLLSRLEVLSPVSRSRSEELTRRLQKEGKQVIITLNKGDTREYSVLHDTLETDATYMMMKGSGIPFRMGVRGYQRRNLAALYRTNERYWRDNLLLHYLPEQIGSVSLLNLRDPDRTFHLARNAAGRFEMSTGTVPGEWSQPTAAKLNQYLGYFYGVRFDDYVDLSQDMTMKHTIRDEPDYVLEVSSITGSRTTVKLFPLYTTDAAGNKKMDPNVLYAKIDDWDGMVILKYMEIDPLLKDPGYFRGR